jgi:hypothetical protein
MRFDRVSYDLDLAEDERCFYHHALMDTHRPMCLGVSDRAVFIARERFLKLQAYTMHRIPLEDVEQVILSRERGPRVWIKWAFVLAFGVVSAIVAGMGHWYAPDVKLRVFEVAGPLAFIVVGLAMLLDNRWRLVLTIKTSKKEWRWRPHMFDKRDQVKALREGFLDACRHVGVLTRRLDLANEIEIRSFWKWFEAHAANRRTDAATVRKRLHKLCDRLEVEFRETPHSSPRQMIITANHARDAFPIVEELVRAAPKIEGLSITQFRPPQKIANTYLFEGVEHPIDQVFFIPYRADFFDLAIMIYADLETTNYEVVWALCRDILGEFDFEMCVSYMQIFPLVDAPFPLELQHISELPGCVEDFHRLDVN